jgi:hypothetical protein
MGIRPAPSRVETRRVFRKRPSTAPGTAADTPSRGLAKTRRIINFFGEGLLPSAGQRSAPPKKTRTRPPRAPCARGVHAPTASATATPSALAAGIPVGAVPGTPAVCVGASSIRPTSVRPAAGLRRCVRRTSRLGLFPPGQSALQPTKQDLCLRPPGFFVLLFFDPKFRPAATHAHAQARRSVEGARSVLPMRMGRSKPCSSSPTTRRHPAKPTRSHLLFLFTGVETRWVASKPLKSELQARRSSAPSSKQQAA